MLSHIFPTDEDCAKELELIEYQQSKITKQFKLTAWFSFFPKGANTLYYDTLDEALQICDQLCYNHYIIIDTKTGETHSINKP